MDDGKGDWEFEDMVTVEKVPTSGICSKLREGQSSSEHGCEAVSTTIVEAIDSAC